MKRSTHKLVFEVHRTWDYPKSDPVYMMETCQYQAYKGEKRKINQPPTWLLKSCLSEIQHELEMRRLDGETD